MLQTHGYFCLACTVLCLSRVDISFPDNDTRLRKARSRCCNPSILPGLRKTLTEKPGISHISDVKLCTYSWTSVSPLFPQTFQFKRRCVHKTHTLARSLGQQASRPPTLHTHTLSRPARSQVSHTPTSPPTHTHTL